jgi:hypothetical protein
MPYTTEWDWPPRQLKRFPPPLNDLRSDHVTDDTASRRPDVMAPRGANGRARVVWPLAIGGPKLVMLLSAASAVAAAMWGLSGILR